MFYVLAVLIIAAALFAVVVPSIRLILVGVIATDVLVGLLLITAGAQLLGVVTVVAPSLCLLVVSRLLQGGGYASLFADLPSFIRHWQWVVAVSAGIGVLLVWTASASASDAVASSPTSSLITVLHYRTPVSVGVVVVLAVVSVAGALLVGRTGDDERRLDRAAEQRRAREVRAALRREQRAAARARRGRPGEGAP